MRRSPIQALAAASCVVLTATSCSFGGLNSLPLPGATGRGPGAQIYHVQIANVSTLESNSPVLVNDVVVGSVGAMSVDGWHADVEISVKPGVVIPANAVAKVGQTSLLGSMHLSLDPPPGQQVTGRLSPGATIPLNKSSTYPSTEQTLSSLSAVVNGGGLGQIGAIIHSFNATLSGRQGDIRELLGQLNDFVGLLDDQKDNIVASVKSVNQLAGTFAAQRDSIARLLADLPPALDALIRERPRITSALQKLGAFSDTASAVINDARSDLVTNLKNLEPALRSLADLGPDLDTALAFATHFPFPQNLIDRGMRGDYMNLFITLDLTIPRLKRTVLLGTRWGQEGAKVIPAPGDPWYLNSISDPLHAPLAPSLPAGTDGGPPGGLPVPPMADPAHPPRTPPQNNPVITSPGPDPLTTLAPWDQPTPVSPSAGAGR
jgi:virulence factor Mce-like protein